jgi:hypothetical protein
MLIIVLEQLTYETTLLVSGSLPPGFNFALRFHFADFSIRGHAFDIGSGLIAKHPIQRAWSPCLYKSSLACLQVLSSQRSWH